MSLSSVSVQHEDFDVGVEINALSGEGLAGAVASFVGLVRGGDVLAMTLEHYPGMTEKALAKIADEARTRWDLIDLTIVHRVGRLVPTDQVVLVVVASGHRGDAFAACEFLMDYLKTQAPFWKKEETPDGARWVDARATDDDAAARWGDASNAPVSKNAA